MSLPELWLWSLFGARLGSSNFNLEDISRAMGTGILGSIVPSHLGSVKRTLHRRPIVLPKMRC